MDNKSLKKLEADLWESADLLRAGSKLTSQQYCILAETITNCYHKLANKQNLIDVILMDPRTLDMLHP